MKSFFSKKKCNNQKLHCSINLNNCFFSVIFMLVFFLCGAHRSFGQTDPDGNTTLSNSLRLWLDASDVFADGSTPTDGAYIGLWKNKAPNYPNDNPVQGSQSRQPIYRANGGGQFDGKPVLEFSKVTGAGNSQDYMEFDVANWQAPYSFFIVFQQTANAGNNDAFFATNSTTTNAFQITYSTSKSPPGFYWRASGSGNIELYFEPESITDSKLYSVLHKGNVSGGDVRLLVDGELKTTSTTAKNKGHVISKYRLNQNRAGGAYQNAKIAEIIMYNRVLSDCETFEINKYLGGKYGKDFTGFNTAYDGVNPYQFSIGVLGQKTDACGNLDQRNTTTSEELTLSNPTSNTTNEDFFSIAHDGSDNDALENNVPAGVTKRQSRAWYVDEDGELGNIDFTFQISQTSLNGSGVNNYVLLVDDDGDFSNATVHGTTGVYSGGNVAFSGINLTQGDYFALAIVDTVKPTVTVEQAAGQTDPNSTNSVAKFTLTFSEPINETTLNCGDISIGGTAVATCTGIVEVMPNNKTTFELTITATADGTVIPSIAVGVVKDIIGNNNIASTSTDNKVTIGAALVSFSSATASDSEGTGGNLPKLYMTGTVSATTTVRVVDNGTGTAVSGGVDYTFTSPKVVTIPVGVYDGTSGTAIAIPTLAIDDDLIVESSETIILSLDTPTGDVKLGTETTHTYTINDDVSDLLATIGTDENDGNTTSTNATAIQLNTIAGVSGAIINNQTAYQFYIDSNGNNFDSPATAIQVQTMIDAVNTVESLLANIGTDATNGNNTNTSTVTAIDLNNITGVSGATSGNQSAYREAIAANEGAFSSPATEAEVQTMINRVNTAESLLVNIGTDATKGNNTNTSTVTAVDLNNITGVSGATSGNESAYREAIAANEGAFSSPATESEVQTMINRVNTAESLLANIGTDAANGNNTNTSTVTAIDLNNITGVSGAISGNESAYSEAIAANEGTFSSPATETEVQTMINRVNGAEILLANIGTDATNGNNTNTSTVTAIDLNNITGVSGATSGNQSAYREAIAANEGAFSSPATEAEVQTMINRVNTAESLLVNIGTDATKGNNTNTSTVTAVDLNNITGVSGATSGNESAYREAIAANEGAFSSPATESEVQTMINRVNTAESLLANIGTDAANGNNTNTSTVTAIDLNNITGVSGATSGNESAYSEAIAANEGTFSSPATEAEVQTMINRVNTVESLLANIGTDAANGNNTNTSTITAVDLNNIAGVSRAISANESAYLTSIAADEGPFSSPATETEVQVMIDLVNTSQIALSEILEDSSSIGGANNINMTSVSAIQLSNIIGITGVNLAEEAAYQQEIEAETGFSNLPSLMKVQAIIDRVNAIAILVENSNDPSDGNPSIVDLANVGVTGAVKANEELYERVIANVILKPTTLAELQKIIDGVNKVIEIVEKSDEPADGSPSKTDLNEVGLENILPGHVDEYEIAIYQSNPKPRNREELQKIIDEVNTIAILVANSNNPSDGNPSVTAITGVGSDRVVPENESKYEEVLAKTDPKPRTLQELQKIIDEVNAIAIIVGNSNNPSDGNPSEQNLIAVGVENVVSNRLGLYEVAIALASPALQGLSELQDIIDAVNVAENVISEILEDSASAGGANNLNTTAITVVQLAGIAGIKNVDLSLEAQYQSKIANETGFSNLPTLTEIQAIIDAVNASVSAITEILEDSDSEGGNVNGNNIAISLVQLTAIVGIEDVDSNLITQYRGEIQKETGFSNLPTLEEIQVLIDRVNYDNEDDDGDGVINLEDAFPDDPEESLDVDGDGIGANADYDDNDSSIGIKAPGLKVPNAITPNGDGINDFWIIEGIENYPNSNVSVYNRYGHLVFEAKGYRNTWNAAYKENTKKLPVGSYLYIIDLGDGSEPTSAWLYINY